MRTSICCFLGLMFLLLANNSATAKSCKTTNKALRAMPPGVVEVVKASGEKLSFTVKVANKIKTRSAGFQRVCQETIAAMPILFVFPSANTPRFHMNNVVAPIDIAFIRLDGSIDSVQHMQPYILMSKEKPTYASNSDVIAALEGHKGFFSENGIDLSAKVSWSLLDKQP